MIVITRSWPFFKRISGYYPEYPIVGARYTVSGNKTVRDRSYSTDILEVIARNGAHARCRRLGHRLFYEATLVIAEHDWYRADHFPEPVSD